eukprot:6960848-Alexandrium_andersonii.AAC.1
MGAAGRGACNSERRQSVGGASSRLTWTTWATATIPTSSSSGRRRLPTSPSSVAAVPRCPSWHGRGRAPAARAGSRPQVRVASARVQP